MAIRAAWSGEVVKIGVAMFNILEEASGPDYPQKIVRYAETLQGMVWRFMDRN